MDKILQVLKKMNEFQEQNNITEQCLTNAQFVYQYIQNNKLGKCNVTAVIAVINVNENNKIVCCCHFVVEFYNEGKNKIIDPSFEYNKHSNVVYYKNYEEFIDNEFTIQDKIYCGEYTKTKYINKFLNFYKLAIQVNLTNKIKNIKTEYYSDLVALIYNL
jgi:hypothetical protein